MKQHISVEQLNQLSEKGKEKLKDMMGKEPLYTIGEMIEFLDENHPLKMCIVLESFISQLEGSKFVLADALWEAVKEVLNGH